jgi:NADH-quinone oxidoreductase subunit N
MTELWQPTLTPFAILAGALLAALVALAVRRDHRVVAGLALAGFAGAFASLPGLPAPDPAASAFLLVDHFAVFFIGLMLAGAFATTLLAFAYLETHRGHREEFHLLLMLATLGAMTLAAAVNFASFFLGLEILSVSLYGLIAYPHFRRQALEAGVKYLILAGASSAFLLFGMALLYLHAGRLDLPGLGAALAGGKLATAPGFVVAGVALFIVGLGFKLALAPFHIWTPDVYQGAPAPATAFLATVSKAAAAAFLLRFFRAADLAVGDPLWTTFAVIAVASMFLGNLLALRQDNVKRLLAYSSIAHLGYVLVAFLAGGDAAVRAVAFYLTAYFATTLTAFGVIAVLSPRHREAETLADFRGMFWRRPVLGALFAGAMLSLAGIPLTAGFVGKYFVVAAGVESSLWRLLVALAINSVIGVFYYLRVVVAMYQTDDASPARAQVPVLSVAGSVALAALALAILLLGILPEPLLRIVGAVSLR